jgi:hypothetical protein
MNQLQTKEAKELHEEMENATTFDMDAMTPQKHIWVDRGVVMSCEFAGHANHRSFKRMK